MIITVGVGVFGREAAKDSVKEAAKEAAKEPGRAVRRLKGPELGISLEVEKLTAEGQKKPKKLNNLALMRSLSECPSAFFVAGRYAKAMSSEGYEFKGPK